MIPIVLVGLKRIVCADVDQRSQSCGIIQMLVVTRMGGIVGKSSLVKHSLRVGLAVKVLGGLLIAAQHREDTLGHRQRTRHRAAVQRITESR
ncbi:hypothetical protein LAUMK136_03129 [Mycobacterium attenuatum]|uniref:Uncharacterized protein n=1 Tax=Mycobacterium attenuatum TaxID=2341086 RepID=A0A498Q449_9MYCO|nr:hypothetical protein LAUMK136_03129 [Mycobacterium attenuatum]